MLNVKQVLGVRKKIVSNNFKYVLHTYTVNTHTLKESSSMDFSFQRKCSTFGMLRIYVEPLKVSLQVSTNFRLRLTIFFLITCQEVVL